MENKKGDWEDEEVLDFEVDEEVAASTPGPTAGAAAGGDLAALFEKFIAEGGLAKSIQSVVEKQVATALGRGTTIGEAEVQVSGKSNRGEGKTARVAQGDSAHGDITPRSSSSGLGVLQKGDDSTGAGCAGSYSRTEARAGGEIIEPFDPDDEDGNIDRWLNKIDQLGRIHGWSDYEKSCFMQAKLRGAARGWFNQLNEFDLSWGEWKGRLHNAFPRRHDFADILEELVARRKLSSESMTRYYHAKLALCGRCGIGGENAICCIIKGLPLNPQATASAFKAKTPEEFYTGFMAGLDRYQAEPDLKRRNSDAEQAKVRAKRPAMNYEQQATPRAAPTMAFKVRCYNCQELGSHLSRDCPKPRMERCMRCGKGGHNVAQCTVPRKFGLGAKQAASTSREPGTKERLGQVSVVP